LEEEFGEEACAQARESIAKELATTDTHFKLVTWPGFWHNKWNDKIKEWNNAGIKITGA
jgi:hypothetical protein